MLLATSSIVYRSTLALEGLRWVLTMQPSSLELSMRAGLASQSASLLKCWDERPWSPLPAFFAWSIYLYAVQAALGSTFFLGPYLDYMCVPYRQTHLEFYGFVVVA